MQTGTAFRLAGEKCGVYPDPLSDIEFDWKLASFCEVYERIKRSIDAYREAQRIIAENSFDSEAW